VEDEGFGELNPCTVSGRIGRLRYLAWLMALVLLAAPAIFCCAWIASMAPPMLGVTLVIFLMIVLVLSCIRISAQRLHDMGLSAWFLLVFLIPATGELLGTDERLLLVLGELFALALMIVPGSKTPNRYGLPPPPTSMAVKVLAAILLVGTAYALIDGISRGRIWYGLGYSF